MRSRNFGVHTTKPGDCGGAPQLVILYNGETNDIPTVQLGNIVFNGGLSVHAAKARGIGADGSTQDSNWHKILHQSILPGNAGVKINGCGELTKQKFRFKCCPATCDGINERTAIEVRAVSECENTLWDVWNEPKEVFFQCGCVETCCQKLNKLADQFNKDPRSPVTAVVVGNEYIEIEAKHAGMKLAVTSVEGLTEADELVPPLRKSFQASTMWDWFGSKSILSPCEEDKCMLVVEIWNYAKRPIRASVATTDVSSEPSTQQEVIELTTVVFDPDNANSMLAFDELIDILVAEDNPLLSRYDGPTSPESVLSYPFCLIRTDAGDADALATAQNDYFSVGGPIISLTRKEYEGGVSYYQLKSKTNVLPTAAETTDKINPGSCGADDKPCGGVNPCPEEEEA